MIMGVSLFSPPVAFVIVFIFVAIAAFLFKGLAIHKDKIVDGFNKPYACGEDTYDHSPQPDYSQFFPYAFFFTIAHVAALIITAVPTGDMKISFMALFYICAVIAGLFILFEK